MNNLFIPTIHPALNNSLGGGFTATGVIEMYGDEGVGKTSTAISLSKHAHVAFIDLDGTFPHHLVELVGRKDQLVLAQLPPDITANQMTDLLEPLARELEVTVIDPLACLPWATVEKLVPIFSRIASQHQILIVLINHANAVHESPSERITSFYCKQRVQMSKMDANEKQMNVQFRITKNLLYPPFSFGTFTIPFSERELST